MDRVYSVAQVNTYVKGIFTNDYLLRHLFVKGEVSNCRYHSSGHIYFTLKDAGGTIACVMFRTNRMAGLRFNMENGQEVVCEGSISVYERDGRYQFYAKSIALSGSGNLHARYEELKQRLYEEGLFEFDIKKEICKYPKRVGIVTASHGAAIEDIKNIAKRRNPYVQLILYPAKVQGDGAAETIVKGIQTLDALGVDTIIIGRGGGSIEDLWAFNEEIVARAIYACETAGHLGAGHEIDNTIADYAADLRAPTPSAACELAIPDVMGMLEQLSHSQSLMRRHLIKKLEVFQVRLNGLQRHLSGCNPRYKTANQKIYLDELIEQLHHVWDRKLQNSKHRLQLLAARLHGLSPTAKLINGFGYIADSAGNAVSSVAKVSVGDKVTMTVHDGVILSEVLSVQESETSDME